MSIVYHTIATYLIKKAGLISKNVRTGAITFIQRFGSALNLNVHFHMLFLDGVFIDDKKSGQRFLSVKTPTMADMVVLTDKMSLRIARYLERAGIINRDAESLQ